MNFSEAIKEYRTRNRLTLKQLSELSGVDPATLNRLERGHGNPRPMTVYMITEAMKLTPDEIDKRLNSDAPESVNPDNNMYKVLKMKPSKNLIANAELESYMFVMFALALLTTTLSIIICFKVFNIW